MPKFAANLTMLFQEVPFLERFKHASQAGFQAVEYLFPYEWPAELLAEKLAENQLKQVLFNLPAGNWIKGERGLACLPGREHDFKEGLELAIHYAKKLGVTQVNCLAGLLPEKLADTHFSLYWDTLVSNVGFAANRLAENDIQLLIEPINSKIDMPGFMIDTLTKASALITETGASNIKIQFDIYHMQIMQGDILRTLTQQLTQIGHIQFADNPGRHEPGTGEINFPRVFSRLDELNYSGWVSAEYIPSGTTEDSLEWLRDSTKA